MKISFALLPMVAFALTACHGGDNLADWISGTDTITCNVDQTVSTVVENQTSQPLTLSFCSIQYHVSNSSQTIPPFEGPTYNQDTVGSVSQQFGGTMGDGCQDRGAVPQTVGSEVPLLSNADLANFKFCYSPTASDGGELYLIVPVASACPADFTTFHQSSVTCQ